MTRRKCLGRPSTFSALAAAVEAMPAKPSSISCFVPKGQWNPSAPHASGASSSARLKAMCAGPTMWSLSSVATLTGVSATIASNHSASLKVWAIFLVSVFFAAGASGAIVSPDCSRYTPTARTSGELLPSPGIIPCGSDLHLKERQIGELQFRLFAGPARGWNRLHVIGTLDAGRAGIAVFLACHDVWVRV